MRARAFGFHSALARSPILSRVYLLSLSFLCRRVFNRYIVTRMENPLARKAVAWPILAFLREITLGGRTRVKLVPHISAPKLRADHRDRHWLLEAPAL